MDFLLEERIVITEEWLLHGTGVSPFGNNLTIQEGVSAKDVFLSLNPGAILFEIENSAYEPFFFKGDLIGAELTDHHHISNMSMVLLEHKSMQKEIKKFVCTEEGLLCFFPILDQQLSKAITLKPSMKIYKIIWFKSYK